MQDSTTPIKEKPIAFRIFIKILIAIPTLLIGTFIVGSSNEIFGSGSVANFLVNAIVVLTIIRILKPKRKKRDSLKNPDAVKNHETKTL